MKAIQICCKSYIWPKLLFVLFSSYFLLGCIKNSPSVPQRVKGRIVGTGNVDGKRQAIVLIHGLESPGDLAEMREKLSSDFPNCIVVDLNRADSRTSSISQQAKDAFEELQKLKLVDKDMVIIGDSQGGLLGWELYDAYKGQLKIKLLVTNHTPWEGAPIATISVEIMERLKSQLSLLNSMVGTAMKHLPFKNKFDQFANIWNGVIDLQPNSPYLQKVKSSLLHAELSILAIGGKIDSISGFAILVGLNPEGIKAQIQLSGADLGTVQNRIEPIFGEVIGNQEHDACIPLDSQLAKNTPTNARFKRITFNNYHHFSSIMQEPVYSLVADAIKEAFQPAKP